jgi:uncharacterized protein
MKQEPLAGWKAFLESPGAPRSAMQPVELEGYLTGIVVAPDLVRPSVWVNSLWGEDFVFDSPEQLQAALDDVMLHYNTIIRQIDTKGADWRPMFFTRDGEVDVDQCCQWVRGFWKAMMFSPEAWTALANDERTRVLVATFSVFIELDEADPQPEPGNADEIRRENAALIPRVLPALRKLAELRTRESFSPIRSSRKAGRNEPCPCGSGKKYKRCCALN